jgi:hypothetical protein
MWWAFTHRDADPKVERVRRLTIASIGILFAALVILVVGHPPTR